MAGALDHRSPDELPAGRPDPSTRPPVPNPPFRCLAQCPPGLEPILARELAELEASGTEVRGGVEWEGDWRSLLRANLELRVAGRVLVTFGAFRARALGELGRKAGGVPWDEWLPDGPVRFRVSASRSRLNHSRAIADRLRGASGREAPTDPVDAAARPSGEPPSPGDDVRSDESLVLVRIFRDEVTLRLDTSGEHLHRRGYRTDIGGAPVRETLAAAMLLATEWTGAHPLADPFCGSGTIPLEAALLARRIAPGLARADRVPRSFAMERWPSFPGDVWEEVVTAARARILPKIPAAILASDRDGTMVEATGRNGERAGLLADLELLTAPATGVSLPSHSGWLVTNPPYGIRLGERRALTRLYGALGRALRGPWREWGLGLLSGDPVLARKLGIPLREEFRTRHGGREVRLLVRHRMGGAAPGGEERSAGEAER